MAECVFPEDIMFSQILTRLPVKSILRFKSVCKPWFNLFSTPRFIKMHLHQFSKHPKNEVLMIYSVSCKNPKSPHTMSIFNIESPTDKNPTQLEHPYCQQLLEMDFVGCVNGMVCLAMPPYGQGIDLWNPATKMSKTLCCPKLAHRKEDMVSLGFGYDAVGDDYKVVRIVCFKGKKKNGIEVYSANSDSWTTIDVGFDFDVLSGTKCGAIVNGNPYWIARFIEHDEILMCYFDVTKMVFNFVSLSSLNVGESEKAWFVEWNGSLAVLGRKKKDERIHSVNVWVFDDAKKIWTVKHTFGPIELEVDRFLQCPKNGKILGECSDGKLFVFDYVNGCVKEFVIDGARKYSYDIYEYAESLTCIKGMEKVVVINRR